MNWYNIAVLVGIILVFIGIIYFGVVHGSNQTKTNTNSTLEMKLGDRWDCGFITNTTTLEEIRNCFRD